jgi:hypothetical protein
MEQHNLLFIALGVIIIFAIIYMLATIDLSQSNKNICQEWCPEVIEHYKQRKNLICGCKEGIELKYYIFSDELLKELNGDI